MYIRNKLRLYSGSMFLLDLRVIFLNPGITELSNNNSVIFRIFLEYFKYINLITNEQSMNHLQHNPCKYTPPPPASFAFPLRTLTFLSSHLKGINLLSSTRKGRVSQNFRNLDNKTHTHKKKIVTCLVTLTFLQRTH